MAIIVELAVAVQAILLLAVYRRVPIVAPKALWARRLTPGRSRTTMATCGRADFRATARTKPITRESANGMASRQAVYLAVDLGASSGRHMAGLFDGKRLSLEEIHRFSNGPVPVQQSLHWDALGLWHEIRQGLVAAHKRFGTEVRSVGVDTWGVDFALLDRHDQLLGNPFHYRDARTAGMMERAFKIVPRSEIFAATGLQFMQFNTLYQLLSMKLAESPTLEVAKTFLMIPDLFHWLLTGEKGNEVTDASTTQFFDPRTGSWATELLAKFGLPTNIFAPLVQPGTKLGPLQKSICDDLAIAPIDVIVPGTHDTASAVVSVPAARSSGERPDWCYISSGTWSLMGVEVPEPIVNTRAAELNFTNEGGVGGTTRVLKNISGLWLIQECRRVWNHAGANFTWEDLNHRAATAPPLVSFIDPDRSEFLSPTDMPQAIRNFCQRTGQKMPEDQGAVLRTALESLAMQYRRVLGWLEELIGSTIQTIHIVGGGAHNHLLCQMAADACGRRVVAGPVEGTAIGNIIVQAVASGDIGSIHEARDIIRSSFAVETFESRDKAQWDDGYERFLQAARAAQ